MVRKCTIISFNDKNKNKFLANPKTKVLLNKQLAIEINKKKLLAYPSQCLKMQPRCLDFVKDTFIKQLLSPAYQE